MDPSLLDLLAPYFARIRQGQLSAEALGGQIQETSGAHAAPLRDLLEQTATRIDLILSGVCEAERDAQIADLLLEFEARLAKVELK